jgi:Na+/H+ antiporter NhaD/arsenite permease-like protein
VAEPFRPESTARQDTDVLPDDLRFAKDTPERPTRRLDVPALVAGLVFVVLAIVLMSGVDLPADWFDHDLGWLALIAAGVALLVNELRKARNRRR